MRNTGILLLLPWLPLAAQESRYELAPDQRTGTIQRIFVLSHSHLDIGFTRPPDEVAREYKDNIDAAIRFTRQNRDFRWTIESAWMLEEWLRRTDDEALVAELGKILREGRMGLGVTFASMHSGLMAAEESNRLVYLGEKFRKKFGAAASVAYQNDVPGFTWAYPRILAGSGVKRLVMGLNLFIGGGNNLGVKQNPFYWTGPDGSRVLTYFTYDSYVEAHRWKLSTRFALEELEKSVPRRLAWLEKNGYRYDTYALMASPGDNIHPAGAMRILERIREWNAKHSELPMQMATAEEFFDYLISKYGENFATASGDAAGHWDIVKLRCPEAASRMREASNLLPAAETASAIAALLGRGSYPRFDLAAAWYSLLSFHEHTADAGTGWPGYFSRRDTDWNNVAHYADALEGFSNTEQQFRRALYLMGGGADRKAVSANILVYNGLSWARSGPVHVERLPAELREGPLDVTDSSTGQKLACEDVPGTKRQILCYARDVPAVGYRTYTVSRGGALAREGEFPMRAAWNAAGFLTSLSEVKSKRELLEQTPGRTFGGLYLSRGRDDFRLEDTGPAEVRAQDGAVTRRIEFVRKGSALPLTTVTLYRDAPYADLRFDVDLHLVRDAAAGNVRFAVALPLGDAGPLYLDGAGFVMRADKDALPGGRPPQYCLVDFFHRGGVTIASRDSAFLHSGDLVLLAGEGMMARTREEGVQRLFRTEPRSSPVLSFRFRIGAQEEEAWRWKRFGAENNLPLRSLVLDSTPDRPARSFFEVSHPGVQMIAFKPAESRPGWYVARLQEISGKGAEGVKLTTAFPIAESVLANLVEEPASSTVNLAQLFLRPWSTLTILIKPGV
jgi:hypothetical protein